MIDHVKAKVMSGNKVILGIVSAAVVGAIIGLLVAPEDGAKMRKKIKRKTNSLAGDLIDALEKSKQSAKDAADNLKEEGSALKDEAVNKAAEYTDTAKREFNDFN
ncbi:YtxH domain-containing protein [Dyadobacter aurulentus]|uniref:YtxH domain-containing protein n=1 Tax=Dyadobacter sp. UC 10 TaxID=2605428 RepID=UPI001CEC8A0D|nr:YtxH domain-containing protein [Dyadobacter sp. UC 10]